MVGGAAVDEGAWGFWWKGGHESQAVDRLAPGMEIEALAEDETIEAIRLTGARSFAVGVQWHAEWKIQENELARRLFEEFGSAARASAVQRGRNRTG